MERLPEDARRRRLVAWLQVLTRAGLGPGPRLACLLPGWAAPAMCAHAPSNRVGNPPPGARPVQRRGHRWDDIRGLLHQLEKEDAQHAIDGIDDEA